MKRRDLILAGSATALVASGLKAEDRYASRPVTVIVPFAAGGSTDLVIRPLAVEMEKPLGAALVIVNRAGAGGAIGALQVARSKADGYTLLVGSAGPMVINPLLRSNLGYTPLEDFAPIAILGTQPLALAVNANVPVKTLAELVALTKTRPMFYGSSGNGGLPHLTGELLRSVTGANVSHVAYQGGGPAVQSIIAGDTQILFDALVSLVPHHAGGKLRILAVCDHQRSPLLKDVPTVAEAGFPDLVSTTSNYFVAPRGTPVQAIERAIAAASQAMNSAALSKKMEQVGVRFDPSLTGPKVTTYMRQETAKWSEVIQRANIKIE